VLEYVKTGRAKHAGRLGLAAAPMIAALASTAALAAAPASASTTPPPGTIGTVAGGVGGPALGTRVAVDPCGITAAGFYGQRMAAGDIYTIAGNGTAGFAGDGGPAVAAELENPSGVAVDGAGNLVVTDSFNQRLRVVAVKTGMFYGRQMTAGDMYTVAGNGSSGFFGDGTPATSAEMDEPTGVAVDHSGNLVIADSFNNVVRVVAVKTGTFHGQAMTAGDIDPYGKSATVSAGRRLVIEWTAQL
jgi:NHL repeat-containing protein